MSFLPPVLSLLWIPSLQHKGRILVILDQFVILARSKLMSEGMTILQIDGLTCGHIGRPIFGKEGGLTTDRTPTLRNAILHTAVDQHLLGIGIALLAIVRRPTQIDRTAVEGREVALDKDIAMIALGIANPSEWTAIVAQTATIGKE